MLVRRASTVLIIVWAVGGLRLLAGAGDVVRLSAYWALRYRCVQHEINLSQAMAKEIDALTEQLDDAGWEALKHFPPPNVADLPVEEGIQKMREHNKLVIPRNRKMMAEFDLRFERLLDAKQRQRLQQVAWQIIVRQALQDRVLADGIGLSKEQRSQLVAIYEQFHDKEDHLLTPANIRSDSAKLAQTLAQMERLYPDWDQAMLQVLTKPQKKQFDELLGKPFDTSLVEKERASTPMKQFRP
jgi:hypothetical protein